MHQRYRLLRLLADGCFHSGEELGTALGIGRSAVWKLTRSLEGLGVDVFAVAGKGYRLAHPLDLLDRERILSVVDGSTRELVSGLEVLPSIDSTNRFLMERIDDGLPPGSACLAEHQHSGRGRRGRAWISPFGANVYLSVSWRFDTSPDTLGGVGLAAGVAVARALHGCGIAGFGLKWPNDVLWEGRKLAGILLEMKGESTGPYDVVVGIGLNVRMPPSARASIDQPWVDIASIAGGPQDRNRIGGLLLKNLVEGLADFSRHGLEPFLAEWSRLDLVQGRAVSLSTGLGAVNGTVMGLDRFGALLLRVDGETRRYVSGEVSLRL